MTTNEIIEKLRDMPVDKMGPAEGVIVSRAVWEYNILSSGVLCVSDIHAVCTPFIGSLCGKLLTGTNTPFAMSSARMAAFLA